MKKVPSIKASAQARLRLYQLILTKLNHAQKILLDSDPALLERIIERLETALLSGSELKIDQVLLEQIFSNIDQVSRAGLQNQVKFLTGDSLWLGQHNTKLLHNFVEEHQKLIKSVQTEQLDKIGLAIKRGIREGKLHKEIVKDIRGMTNISKRRALLIARNSVLQYSGAVTKQSQINAGIKSYIWQSSRDERVRDSHRKLDGEIFSWDEPGPHPRSEVNCRCDAIPVLN